MKKFIPLLIITSLLLSACSIDWDDSKELEMKKFEFEKQKYEEGKMEKYEKECNQIYEENSKKYEDFINTCTGSWWNSIEFCVRSDAGKILLQKSLKSTIKECINEKINKSNP